MDKPVDSAQIVLDKRGPSPASGGGGAAAGKVWVALKVFGVAFVVCNVTALYVLHFVNRPSPTTRFTSEQFASTGGTKAAVGDVVSMGADNYLRNGAGTTAYVGLSSVEESGAAYIEYINIARGGTTGGYQPVNLISYRCIHPAGGAANFSAITTVTVNTATKTVTVDGKYDSANKVADDAIRGIATLSDTRALVMTVDDSTYNYKTYLIPATISSTSVLLDQTKKSKVAEGSATQFITALSSTAALFTYYGAYAANADYFQFVKVAIVDSAGQITTSTAKQFGPANNDNTFMMTTFGKPVVLPSTDGAFVIPYYSAAWDASAKANDTGLCVTTATYTSSSNSIGAFTTGVCNTKYRPAYYPEGIMLSDNVLLLAFHDDANNNALTLTTLHVTATAAYFRSSYVFPEVAGAYNFGTQYAFSPEISLALLAGNRVVVSFLNPSMDGKQSVKVLQYSTSSLTFKDVTPVLPIAASDFTLDMKNGPSDRNKAVTHRVFPVSDDGVLAMHMGTRGLSTYNHAALVDVFGAPVGVLRDYDGKSKADVAISGKANDVNTFTGIDMAKGTTYYATSSGQVVSADSTTAFGAEYFQAKENPKLLVTADSKIGVALDDDTLFVSTSA